MIDKKYIAKRLKKLGKLLEVSGENPFKIRAYSNGARILEKLPEPIEHYIETNTLATLKGVGTALRDKIIDIYETGTTNALEKMEKAVPVGVQEMLEIKGLGPKKVAVIWQTMGITTRGELLYACNENRLVEVKGFGAKTQATIIKLLEFSFANDTFFHYARLKNHADQLLTAIHGAIGAEAQVSLSGEIRRKVQTLEAIEVLADASHYEALNTFFNAAVEYHVEETDTELIKLSITGTTIPIHIRFTSEHFVNELFLRTGGPGHAEAVGADLSIAHADENAIYGSVGMAYIVPELRENRGEVALAKENKLPNLIVESDIKGLVHTHTTWSDGANTLEQMAKACMDRGYEYMINTDHSKAAFYANGLSEGRLEQQHIEIDGLNTKLAPFKIFKGIEADILHDGSLDYDASIWPSFDFIIASVHAHLKMDEEKATSRLISAIENPYTNMLGHPTGRLLLIREAYPIDHQKVIDACAANGVMIEINANPYRLDLDWTWVGYALEKGVMLSVNPDSHSVEGINDTQWGIAAGRKGGLTAAQCFNTHSLAEIEQLIAVKRGSVPSS